MRYIDIGHGGVHGFLWLYQSRLPLQKVNSASHWTHDKMWGADAMKHWRGRYEEKSRWVSIMPPVGRTIFEIPEEVIEQIEHSSPSEYWFFPSPI